MKRIWAPWRMQYILHTDKGKGCILCDLPDQGRDEANYILHRGKYNFIILNAFPYTPGHLMIAPYRHIANVTEASIKESKEHIELIQVCVKLLSSEINAASFNIGMNIGRVAGAGVEGHIHTHVVPRWGGDNNFMAVVADTRVLSEGLKETYSKLKKGLKKLVKDVG
jgi:ATP adenylyltransferase